MKQILTIARKELKTYFNNPTAYVIIVAFLLLWEFLFFRNVFLVGQASLAPLFGIVPWIFLLLIPALTMGSLAEEKSDGTIEFLLTHPIQPLQLVIGKFLGSLLFMAITLLFIFPLAWSLNHFGNLDWGVTFSQYLATLLLSAVLINLGIFISGFFTSQISALLVSAIASFFLTLAGSELLTARLPLALAPLLEQLSTLTHFGSMSRGVIDLRDVWYFVSLSAVFIGLSYMNLLKNKFGNRKAAYRTYQTAIALLVGIAVLSNIVGSRIPGRLDMTEENIFTLSGATKKVLADVDDIVTISLYASDKLPAQYQPVLRETKDILHDYQTASKGTIRVENKNPDADSSVAKEAASLGIQQIRFNVVSQEEFQAKDGFLGLSVAYGDKHEAIPFLENTNDLEYQLTSLIQQLTAENKTKIAFLSGHGEKSLMSDYRILSKELSKQFEVAEAASKSDPAAEAPKKDPKSVTAPKDTPKKAELTIPEDTKVLVIAGPNQEVTADEQAKIKEFMAAGGNVLFMIEGVNISPQSMAATANEKNLADFVKEQTGVEVKKGMVYDLRSNETVTFGGGPMQYLLPYPLWIRAVKSKEASPITSKIESVAMPWASPVAADENLLKEKGFKSTPLFTTTGQSGVQTAKFDIQPDQKFSTSGLTENLVAVALLPENDSAGRIIVVGDSDFLGDQMAQQSAGNLAFGMEAISWLAQENSLAEISVKNNIDRHMTFTDKSQTSLVKFGNLAVALIIPAGYGAYRLSRRKRQKNLPYSA